MMRIKPKISLRPLILLLLACGLHWLAPIEDAWAEDHVYGWTRALGAGTWEWGFTIDNQGNTYITGGYNGTVDFDPGPAIENHTSLGSGDIFLCKYDKSGSYQWTRTVGGPNNDYGRGLVVTASGELYLTGKFYGGPTDFDPGAGTDIKTSTQDTMFLSKYDTDGNYFWTKRVYGSGGWGGPSYGHDITQNSQGELFIVGRFAGTINFHPDGGTDSYTSTALSGHELFVSKYDPSGNYLWTRIIGGSKANPGELISIDTADNIYISGLYSDTVDFDPGPGTDNRTSQGLNDIYITKIGSDGTSQWTRTIGGPGNDSSYAVATDSLGNAYLVGGFENTVDFDPGPQIDNRSSQGSSDGFITKLDNNGDYLWTRTAGGDNYDYTYAVATDALGNVFIGGSFSTSVDFDPGVEIDAHTSAGSSDAYLIKLDTSGNYQWTKTFGGTAFDYIEFALADSSNNLLLVGYFNNAVDFDPSAGSDTLGSDGSSSAFLAYYPFDDVPPPAPIITDPLPDTLTNDNQPTVQGTAEAGASIILYRNGIIIGTAVADSSGLWSYPASQPWADGIYLLSATATDSAQNTSPSSDITTLTIDTMIPESPNLAAPPWGNRTDTLTPLFGGSGELEQVVKIWLDDDLNNSTPVDSSGLWFWQPSTPLTIGTHEVQFSVVDGAQNESSKSSPYYFEVVDDYDYDGLTTTEEEFLGTDPHNADSDNDGSNDGEELATGSNPLDRGSVLSTRERTLCAEWNGFLDMWNVLEHVNTSVKQLNIESTLRNLFGQAQPPVTFALRSGYQYDLLGHDLTGFQADSYGMICSTATNGQRGDLDGRMVFYKPDTLSGGYQFAFALPLGTGLTGTQYIPYNTYQPSLDLEDKDNLAANWIQLTNLTTSKQSGTLIFYDRSGTQAAQQAVTLQAGARFDFSAHDIVGREKVGIVEWIPTLNAARFQLRNVRYYYRADGVIIPLGEDFDSAFQLEGVSGSGQLLSVPLDTENSSAVLEIANTLNEDVKVDVRVYSSTGGIPLHDRTFKLKPHATYHLITDSILKGAKGIATVQGSKPGSVIATAMEYGRSEILGIQTVYGIQASEALGTVMRGSYNTFLNQGCRLLMVNPTSSETVATVAMKRYDGTIVELGRMLAVPAHGLTDYNLCQEEQKNVYGVVTVQTATPNTIFATVLRIGDSEDYRFPTPVRQ